MFEVLKIQEITNNLQIDPSVRNKSEAYNKMLGTQLQLDSLLPSQQLQKQNQSRASLGE